MEAVYLEEQLAGLLRALLKVVRRDQEELLVFWEASRVALECQLFERHPVDLSTGSICLQGYQQQPGTFDHVVVVSYSLCLVRLTSWYPLSLLQALIS
jgi:hypothetical protein